MQDKDNAILTSAIDVDIRDRALDVIVARAIVDAAIMFRCRRERMPISYQTTIERKDYTPFSMFTIYKAITLFYRIYPFM